MSSAGDRASGALPYGFMSLWDMVNCSVMVLASVSGELMLQIGLGDHLRSESLSNGGIVDGSSTERMGKWLKLAAELATEFEWQAVHDRIEIFKKKLEKPIKANDFLFQIEALNDAIRSGVKHQLVYRYPSEQAKVIMAWTDDWASTLDKFPSSKKDIVAGVDCWALHHHTASVFHMMRVLEHGLRALSTDVGVNFDIQYWQNVIDEIESKIRESGKTLPRGSAKNERLQFLSEAAKEFVYFKDGWRNYVSHNRGDYDQYQARSVMEHVKAFMNHLSSRLSE